MSNELIRSTNGQYLMNKPHNREIHADATQHALRLHLILFFNFRSKHNYSKNVVQEDK